MPFEFEWRKSRLGYAITDRDGNLIENIQTAAPDHFASDAESEWWLWPADNEYETVRPFDIEGPKLCRQLADVCDDELWVENALDFVNTFGLLTETEPGRPELLGEIRSIGRNMGIMLSLYDDARERMDGVKRRRVIARLCDLFNQPSWGEASASLHAQPGHFPILTMSPKNLHHALWLEFAEMMQWGDKHQKCDWCGGWYMPQRKRLSSANKFCSAQCGQSFRNSKRKEKR